MKKFSIIFISLLFLSACSNNSGISDISENATDILHQAGVEQPSHGDIFLIQNNFGEQIIYAYIEKDSTVHVKETDDNVMNIFFEEPEENADVILQTFEIEEDMEGGTINFYLNGEVIMVTIIYE